MAHMYCNILSCLFHNGSTQLLIHNLWIILDMSCPKFSKCVTAFQILRGAETIEGRPGESMPPLDFDALKQDLKVKFGDNITTKDALSSALYPKVFDDYRTFRDKYGPVDKLDTRTFLVGPEIAEKLSVSKFVFQKHGN